MRARDGLRSRSRTRSRAPAAARASARPRFNTVVMPFGITLEKVDLDLRGAHRGQIYFILCDSDPEDE